MTENTRTAENTTMTERTTMTANTEGAYLRDVGKRLRALTPEQREAVLDDVRAHFAEAEDAGRTPEQAAESLGDPAQFTERVRAELGHEPGRTDRMRRILLWLATGVAVFTTMFETFVFPSDEPDLEVVVEHGFEVVLLHLLVALLAALPILVPLRARTIATAAVAITLTVATNISVFGVYPMDIELLFYQPTAMLVWAALITPILARNGRPSTGWRIAAAVLTALPGLYLLSALLVGSFGTNFWGVLYIAVSFGLAVLMTFAKAWPGIVLAVGGVALLVSTSLDPVGMLTLLFWWAGGLFFTVGVSHALAHARPRKPAHQ
ncbi:HAAS signaling domain-containing protein [Promicromonospora sp. CA-289599]|uniref:HAAS signaling domain-containing protein n=1 Tax=Promicromonospora sp. CA-289599 TaxID=3240014 RepID=UPI003D8FA80A